MSGVAEEEGRPTMVEDGRRRGIDRPGYEVFIGILTVVSLGIVAFQLVVRSEQVQDILVGTDALLCFIFLLDTLRSWYYAPDRLAYALGPRPGRSVPTGIVELLGCVPWLLPLRVLRVSRLIRVRRDLRNRPPEEVLQAFIDRRAEAAAYLVIFAALSVMLVGSSLIALIEPPAPGSNIKTGGDAFWCAFVTITTVGYGDRYPVTGGGRVVGMVTMAVGIVIFGVLTSFLAQSFMRAPGRRLRFRRGARLPELAAATAQAPADADAARFADDAGEIDTVAELRALRAELASVRELIETRLAAPLG